MQILITSENLPKFDVGNGVLPKEIADIANNVNEKKKKSTKFIM